MHATQTETVFIGHIRRVIEDGKTSYELELRREGQPDAHYYDDEIEELIAVWRYLAGFWLWSDRA